MSLREIFLIVLVVGSLIVLGLLAYFGIAIAGMREAGLSEEAIDKVLKWRQKK
jgi:hypothetical protein